MNIVAIGTARNAGHLLTRAALSCAYQGVKYHLIDASSDPSSSISVFVPGFRCIWSPDSHGLANMRRLTDALDPDTICLWLDGDDELLPGAVERIRAEYTKPDVLLTYGSFEWWIDGKRDYTRPWNATPTPDYVVHENAYRKDIWRATHLRTFKAGLFQAIPNTHLQWPTGNYVDAAYDLATMWAMLELAGGRFSFIRERLYRYNFGAVPQPAESVRVEDETVRYLRSLKPLARM